MSGIPAQREIASSIFLRLKTAGNKSAIADGQ